MKHIPFTGFDVFFLALEKYDKFKGSQGNTCHYLFDLDERLSVEVVQALLDENKVIDIICSLKHRKGSFISIPHWYKRDSLKISVNELESDESAIDIIQSEKISLELPLALNLIQRTSGKSSLIFSWYHLLMDGYGALLLIKSLFSKSEIAFETLVTKDVGKYNFNTFLKAARMKFFIDNSSRGLLSGIAPLKISTQSKQRIKIIEFSDEETQQLDKAAIESGAIYGRTAFLLACASRVVQAILNKRGEQVTNFWIPVPRDDRKKGGQGPILGNRLSFLFYRLRKSELRSIKETVRVINSQMKNQIRMNIPLLYKHLMNYMKWLPLSIYHHLVKRKGANSIAAFLFTIAPDHPKELMNILDRKVVSALNVPSNAHQPGLTFSFLTFNGSLHLMVLYYDQVLAEDEFRFMERQLREELLTGNEYRNGRA